MSNREKVLEQVAHNIHLFVSRRHAEWAADIVQESLLVIHLKYPEPTEAKDLIPLGIKIAKLKIFEHLRRARRAESQLAEGFDIQDSNAVSVEQRLQQNDAAQRLLAGVSQLGEVCARIIRMLIAGKKSEEIRQILGITDRRILDTRLFRCRQRLKLIMGWSI